MTVNEPLHPRRRHHLVRPRWVWGGLLVALIGGGLLGLGIALLSWTLSVIGTVLLLGGATASLRGGAMYDAVPGMDIGKELRQVREGDIHQGVAAGDTVTGSRASKDAIRSNQTTHELEAAARHPAPVHWAPVAGGLLLLVAAVLMMSQWELVAPSTTGRGNSFRDTGLAIVLGLAGLRLVVAPGRHAISVGITLLAGLGLVVGGLVADHDHVGLAILEFISGCIAILCSLTAWFSSVPREKDQPSRARRGSQDTVGR